MLSAHKAGMQRKMQLFFDSLLLLDLESPVTFLLLVPTFLFGQPGQKPTPAGIPPLGRRLDNIRISGGRPAVHIGSLRIPKMAPEMGTFLGPKLEPFWIPQQCQNALIPLCFGSKRHPKGAVFSPKRDPKRSRFINFRPGLN